MADTGYLDTYRRVKTCYYIPGFVNAQVLNISYIHLPKKDPKLITRKQVHRIQTAMKFTAWSGTKEIRTNDQLFRL